MKGQAERKGKGGVRIKEKKAEGKGVRYSVKRKKGRAERKGKGGKK